MSLFYISVVFGILWTVCVGEGEIFEWARKSKDEGG